MPSIADNSFDLIIIGAGINGAGIARDAAMRGLRVLLFDKDDIGGGTTAASTRLIHGGLRYLEHLEFGLVRESLRERERLLRIAPHLIRPLQLLIPIYRHSTRGPWTIRSGMLLYDLLSYDKSLDRHRMLSREEALRRVPGLEPEGLLCAAVYFDTQVEFAERLAVENALSARECGALVMTYSRVDGGIVEGGAVRGVEFTNLSDGSKQTALASIVINAAGPWVDLVLRGFGPQTHRIVGGTKGSHIVVSAFPEGPATAIYAEAAEDHRPFFIIPWNGMYLIGTTDARYSGDLDCVEASEGEIVYLIREANRLLPAARLDRHSVLFTYSGVRPLPYSPSGAESAITRKHIIHDHSQGPGGRIDGLLSVAGGKLTTYRNLSEHVVDVIFKKFGRTSPKCATAEVALPGAAGDFAAFATEFAGTSGFPPAITSHLLRVYGTRAGSVSDLARQNPELADPLCTDALTIGAEVVMSFQSEMAVTLTDVLLRRTMTGLAPSAGVGADEAAARVAQRYLGWDGTRAAREVAEYRRYIKRRHPRRAET